MLRFSFLSFIFRCLCDLAKLKGRTDLLLTVLDKSMPTQIMQKKKKAFSVFPCFQLEAGFASHTGIQDVQNSKRCKIP